MKNSFRKKHLLNILNEYSLCNLPLDRHLSKSFKKLKQIGSKDRKEITETIYSLIRHKNYYEYFCDKPINWEKILNVLEVKNHSFTGLPDHIKLSFPKFLFDKLIEDYGETQTKKICNFLNQKAPITIRINPLKTSIDRLIKILSPHTNTTLCSKSPYGIKLEKRINFHLLDAYKTGLFEVQDEASQLIAMLAKVSKGEKILDFCAGSGGKSLAFGPFMQNKGLICLYDIRKTVLDQAKKRFKKSGIQNVQFIKNLKLLKRYISQMDWVFLDVPCSGTGVLRRNPDMKWKITNQMISDLITKQRLIFQNALKYLKPNGKIVYATCSILKAENEHQIDFFKKEYGLQLIDSFSTIVNNDQMDGFFGAVLQKK